MTVTTLALPPLIKGLKPYQGRIGRRVVALFFLSALIPLSLCAAFLFHGFNAELSQAQTQSLDGLLRNFGMTLIGRLDSAAEELTMVMAQSGRNSEKARANVAKLAWAHSVSRSDGSKGASWLPRPN